MTRLEQDREDILREATALVRRVEVELQGFSDPVTIGFRRDGSASFYFGADLVLQFNSQGELRRGYVEGRFVKAEQGTLVTMEKNRTEKAVELRSHLMLPEEAQQFLQMAERNLVAVLDAIQSGTLRVLRQVPQETVPDQIDIVGEVAAWLAHHAAKPIVARSARSG